jgi:hypothetical protein
LIVLVNFVEGIIYLADPVKALLDGNSAKNNDTLGIDGTAIRDILT